jgi:prolipoprotein diacylglyceryltransferase
MFLCLALLGALLPFHQKLKARLPQGVTGFIYVSLYAIGRFFLSFLRTDPSLFLGLRQAQLASLLMVAIAVVASAIILWRTRAGSESVTAAV